MEDTKSKDKERVQRSRVDHSGSGSGFDEAVDRIYQKYGPDLGAFVRDVKKDIQKNTDDKNRRAALGASF